MDKLDEIINILYYIADALEDYKKIKELPDCNTCGAYCGQMPLPGEPVRINCPRWEPK